MLGRSCLTAAASSTCLSRQALTATPTYLSTSACLPLRKIVKNVDDKTTTVEGVYIPSDRKDNLLQPSVEASYSGTPCKSEPCNAVTRSCHPFCRFNFVHEVKHTDVLIISQFMDSQGKIMDREVTGLCKRQHTRVNKLIKMAAKSGLFPKEQDQFREEKEKVPGANLNCYYDERTIDIQHMRNVRNNRRFAWKDVEKWNQR